MVWCCIHCHRPALHPSPRSEFTGNPPLAAKHPPSIVATTALAPPGRPQGTSRVVGLVTTHGAPGSTNPNKRKAVGGAKGDARDQRQHHNQHHNQGLGCLDRPAARDPWHAVTLDSHDPIASRQPSTPAHLPTEITLPIQGPAFLSSCCSCGTGANCTTGSGLCATSGTLDAPSFVFPSRTCYPQTTTDLFPAPDHSSPRNKQAAFLDCHAGSLSRLWAPSRKVSPASPALNSSRRHTHSSPPRLTPSRPLNHPRHKHNDSNLRPNLLLFHARFVPHRRRTSWPHPTTCLANAHFGCELGFPPASHHSLRYPPTYT